MKTETKISIALHIVAMIMLTAIVWILSDYKAALISLIVYVTCAAVREMGKQEGQERMREKCQKNFIEGVAWAVKDTDLAMKALGIDEETQEKIRKARLVIHNARCSDMPVPDKITIEKDPKPQPPSFKEAQGESEIKVEHAVGERFEIDGITYEVRESKECSCDGCALYHGPGFCSYLPENRFGSCSPIKRKDGKDVIFVEVEESEK